MNGNNPYAGAPGVTPPGQRNPADLPELSPEQQRVLRGYVNDVAARTREYLPGAYAVGAELRQGATGPEALVAVHPPVGHAVSAGLAPDAADLEDDDIPLDDVEEVARSLAATAAFQVKQALGNETLAAR